MRVKAADIARELQISKATVSLALNNKPGVSEQTRQLVFACKERLEHKSEEHSPANVHNVQIIKVIFVNRNLKMIYESEMDLLTDTLEMLDRESKRLGYSLGLSYVNMLEDSMEQVVNECNTESVAGVLLYATEMQPVDYAVFKKIKKPMIICDNDFEDNEHHAVCIDNASGVRTAVEYLLGKNCRQIKYLANEIDIYNFRKRREGFKQAMYKNGQAFEGDMIVTMGKTIAEAYERMKEYLLDQELPDAFLMENYQVSIGVMQAMRERGIRIPEDISLIGIDELPSYATGDCKLTMIQIAHTDRASMAISLLQREILESIPTKFKVMSNCLLMEGDSVR